MRTAWYVIFTADTSFLPLEIILCTREQAQDRANELADELREYMKHYDILGPFKSKRELQKALISQALESWNEAVRSGIIVNPSKSELVHTEG